MDRVQLDIPLYTTVSPLDLISSPNVLLQWSGTSTDGTITGYDVYVQTGEGMWELWLENTLQISANWQGLPNTRYGFYVTARDSTGASVPAPEETTAAQAETYVVLVVRLVDIEYGSPFDPMSVSFSLIEGASGDVCNVQRSSSVKGPWTNAGIVTLDENSAAIFQDNNAPPPDIFYQGSKP